MESKILSALTLLALLATFVHATPDVFAEDAPLAIVFDVSGSMNENDSSGTVKLATAKAATPTGIPMIVMERSPQAPVVAPVAMRPRLMRQKIP